MAVRNDGHFFVVYGCIVREYSILYLKIVDCIMSLRWFRMNYVMRFWMSPRSSTTYVMLFRMPSPWSMTYVMLFCMPSPWDSNFQSTIEGLRHVFFYAVPIGLITRNKFGEIHFILKLLNN